MKIAIAQLNPTVGDLDGNLKRLETAIAGISSGAADLLVTPELCLVGYPPRDLLALDWFIKRIEETNERVRQLSVSRPDLPLLVGTITRNTNEFGRGLYNSALLLENGQVVAQVNKQLLPTYDVFDEDRYFDEGNEGHIVEFHGHKLGISICEDAWNDPEFEKTHRYDINPIETLAREGAEIQFNLSASPWHWGKEHERYRRIAFHAQKWSTPFVFIGQTGANDDLVFDGISFAVDSEGKIIGSLAAFEEDVKIVDVAAKGTSTVINDVPEIEMLRRALVLGVRDYFRKCGFKTAVLGLSGGIDSALTACIAADALGPENVRGVTMPSRVSSAGSVQDSLDLAKNLGIVCDQVPIADIFEQFNTALTPSFAGKERDVTEENLQARIRGTLLMAYSNKFGSLLLTTGNKSELAVGYCTLYGDMNGGLAVISDLPKTTVYELSRWYNRETEVIPNIIIEKPPSAELAEGQVDQDSLPPYDVLDDILHRYLEAGEDSQQIIAAGHEPDTVAWVIRTVNLNEYKRQQAAPNLRVTSKAFGTGRRMPIAAKWPK